ncbi:MAG: hypothetical protein M3291_06020 [Actinomycetota bacterium]|nr:hypothetical protein [Actinomycetota bacterium]
MLTYRAEYSHFPAVVCSSARFTMRSTLRLNSAVTPALSSLTAAETAFRTALGDYAAPDANAYADVFAGDEQ